ncbi:retrotransposon hot spot (RHS) protein, partial [Trypanosoma grayi]|uniref:retrotransposon hot spot (RHS) protein n=1 Tax=Trypanosoma grayi TaxID=71804 RepID=UPI0004F47DC3
MKRGYRSLLTPLRAITLLGNEVRPPCVSSTEMRRQKEKQCHNWGTVHLPVHFTLGGVFKPTLVAMAPRIVAGGTTGDKALSDAAATKSVKWTLDSTVEEVLLQGNLPPVHMKLKDFLTEYLDGMGADEVKWNVSIEAFANRPNRYIKDEELVTDILAMPSFKAIVEEMKNREAVRKLKETGVYSLQQWDVYDKK